MIKQFENPPSSSSSEPLRVSSDNLSCLLKRVYWDEMRSVESFSIAIRYFSRFPTAALSFARCSADEARHVAVVADRLINLTGAISAVPSRSAALERMPGFKSDAHGELNDLVRFVSRTYADKETAFRVYKTVAESVEADSATRKIFRRLAQDERAHVGTLDKLIRWLREQGYSDAIQTAFAEDGLRQVPED